MKAAEHREIVRHGAAGFGGDLVDLGGEDVVGGENRGGRIIPVDQMWDD